MDRISIIAGVCDGEAFIVNTEVRVSQVTELIQSGVKASLIYTHIFPQITAEDVAACMLFASLEHSAPSVTYVRKNMLPPSEEEYDPASQWGGAPAVSDANFDPASQWGWTPVATIKNYDPASKWGGTPVSTEDNYDPASKWGGTPVSTDENYDPASKWGVTPLESTDESADNASQWGATPKLKATIMSAEREWSSSHPKPKQGANLPKPYKKKSFLQNAEVTGFTIKIPIFGKSLSNPKALLISCVLGSASICAFSMVSIRQKPPKPYLRLSPALETRVAMQQGDEAYKRKQFDRAKNAYLHAKEINPNDSRALNNLGLVYQIQNRESDAEGEFKSALSISPDDSTYHYNLGLLYARGKRFKEAEDQFIAAIRLKPDAEAHNNLGGILYEEGDYDAAIEQYRTALEMDPKCQLAKYNLHEVEQLLRKLAKKSEATAPTQQ